jgi:ribose phosphate pyrophosphokinase-like protein
MMVVAGSASVALARLIAKELAAAFVDVAFERHRGVVVDSEHNVRLLGRVAGDYFVLVQTTHPDPMIVELFLLADAIRDAGARSLPAVVRYFGHGRQETLFLDGKAISAKTIAKPFAVDFDELLTMAIHNSRCPLQVPAPAHDVSGMPAIGRYHRTAKVDTLLAPLRLQACRLARLPRANRLGRGQDALDGSSGSIIQASWPEFTPLASRAFSKMALKLVVDARRTWPPERVQVGIR